MKQFLLGLFLICALWSCDEKKKQKDSIDNLELQVKAKKYADSVVNSMRQQSVEDEQKRAEASSPVRITNARLSTDEYGSTDVVVSVKNNSGKVVDGIKVKWTLKNNFGELVNEVYNSGISQNILSPNKSASYRWEIYTTTATRVSAFVYEVHFKNGETWTNNK